MVCNGLLVGITHAGAAYCNTYLPGIYMNIPHFFGWINAKIGAKKPPNQPREIRSEPAGAYEYLENVQLVE